MAEVSNSHVFHYPSNTIQEQGEHQQQEEKEGGLSNNNHNDDAVPEDDLYPFDFDPLSPPNISFFVPSPSFSRSRNCISCPDSDSDSDSNSNSGSIYFDGEEELDQMNFVTDLFASRGEEIFTVDDQDMIFRGFDGGDEFGSSFDEEDLGLGFVSHIEFDNVAQLGQFPASLGSNSSLEGLRVVGIGSDSDSEEFIQDDPFGESAAPLFWDGIGFEEQRAINEELEWEEVEERVDERNGLSSVIERIEELSVSSEISNLEEETSDGIEEAERNLEWEFLLAVSNVERNLEFENDGYGEYDSIFGQLMQNESASKGSPPTSKSVVENLPTVVLTTEELRENSVVCAVCKDDISVEEKVTRLPCFHHYHGDCIVPWLSIRNTCPVCRHELPTDDLDYERRKTQGGGIGLAQNLEIRYNFEALM